MRQFDFTTQPNRLAQHSEKWKTSEREPDLLQMWVADMDFLPFEEIRDAIKRYANDYIFGYTYASDELYQSIIDWEKSEHDYAVTREDIVLIEGVVPAISIAVQALTNEGDAVLINTPVYPPFARTVKLNQRKLVTNSLIKKKGRFELDLEQLEKDLVEQDVKLYILCSPHNPGGRVWLRDELEAIGHLCRKYGVLLVSDEIHQDLTLFGHKHHSFNTLQPDFKDFTIILSSATKTFNIAGTKNSFAIIENKYLKKRFTRRQLGNNHHEVSTVGLLATEAAFSYGKPWLEELKVVLEQNIDYVVDYLSVHTKIDVMKPEGTYLVWLDFSAYGLSHEEVHEKLRKEARVVLNDGVTFGGEGICHARFNAATPFETVQEACERIARVFEKD
ncbi:MalY/PatB family protein [Streptococcus cuniculi]|uniref:cysteine-S-conjugate beta-lyase n=1 Tax=Streptococcus cuniculi TaxID=1432788 RepID=A0A4Y9J7M2_9STRE|nr:MalY/PatB family protein [Streptococcus cuniculi]MBF0779182.1 pyridoxal phosphate-dependent aminotransferase [Streptococcus cuniculi]TFU96842.1 pyridoxal phosphate-dependent aminotransferase [Streptococcus cuniculi]